MDVVSEHYEAILRFYGRDLGVRVARKHLGWYADEAGVDPSLRAALMTEADPARVAATIRHAFGSVPERSAA